MDPANSGAAGRESPEQSRELPELKGLSALQDPGDFLQALAGLEPWQRLQAILSRLRDDRWGCPWDQVQTAASLAPYVLEEAYEVVEAIAQGDPDALCNELGDLLFQVVFQAQIAAESGFFHLDTVATAIGDKLLQRHPHVFAQQRFADAQAREAAWEESKVQERRQRERHGRMDEIPLAMPALARAVKLQRRARQDRFDWPDATGPLAKIHEEIAEVQQVQEQGGNPERLTEEIGDLLFSVVNWARHLGVEPESALRGSNRRFEQRFRRMEADALQQGRRLSTLSPAEREGLWQQAKRTDFPPLEDFEKDSSMQPLTVPDRFMPARIERIELVTPQIRQFTLQTDAQRFCCRPGQWIDVWIPAAGPAVMAGYSVVSAPRTDGRLQLAIKAADHHPATHHLHTDAREGDSLWITAGQGPFYFSQEMASSVVLLAAGIGVTPLLSILRYIHAEAPEVAVHLIYSVTARSEALATEELARMAQRDNISVTLTVTREAEDWRGHTGRIGHALLESLHLPREALYYYCGSREFIEDMTQLLQTWGIPSAQLKYEKWW